MAFASSKAITQVAATLAYQSYFDSTLLESAVEIGQVGSVFAGETQQKAITGGRSIVLHPASTAPIAARFSGGAADSSVVLVTPGQAVDVGPFDRVDWGLPTGWLGGGQVILYALHDDRVALDFPSVRSVGVFQRVRVPVVASIGALRKNWPGVSPWPFLVASTTPLAAGAVISPRPDLVLGRCMQALAAPIDVLLVWRGIDDFDTDGTGTLGVAAQTSWIVTIPASPDGTSLPYFWLPAEVARLTSSGGGLAVIDPSNTIPGTAATSFVDFVRYVQF